MDVLRARLLRHLCVADSFGQFRAYYPHIPSLNGSVLDLHSKVMVMDDHFARVGSANLNNRSMGLDTECDLAVDIGHQADPSAVASLRNRLLAEHLNVTERQFQQRLANEGSLIQTIESFLGAGRSLRELAHILPPELEERVPDAGHRPGTAYLR